MRVNKVKEAKLDRSAFSVGSISDPSDEIAYWQSRTPEERLMAVELYRQIVYGYDPATTRMQKVLEIEKRKSG
jgi:hypothetical protein